MKNLKYLIVLLLLSHSASAQTDSSTIAGKVHSTGQFSIEPGFGIKPGPTSPSAGIVVSNIIDWNMTKRFSIVSYSSYTFNNAFLRNFNYIKTNYSYSLNQKFGIGVSLNGKHSSHSFSLMGGIQSDNFSETMNNPEFEKIEVSRSVVSPDFGILYDLKVGKKKYFFSYRMYLPLYPYPFKSSDINSIDGNISNLSIEFGLGIRLR